MKPSNLSARFQVLAPLALASAIWITPASAATFNWARGITETFSWNNNATFGNTNGNNWSTTPAGAFPNAAEDIANFINNTGAGQTMNLGQNITIGQLVFGNGTSTNTRTVASGGAGSFVLTMNNGAANAVITQGSSSTGNVTAAIGISGNGNLNLNNTSSGQLNINGGITSLLASGTQGVNKVGTGTVTVNSVIGDGSSGGKVALTVSAGTLNLNAGNTYTGATTINAGTLVLGGTAGALATTSPITNDGVLTIARTNAVVQGTDFAGGITGTGSLNAIGTGLQLTLNTGNSYAGVTTIGAAGNNAVVRATASGALGTGTLQFDGTGNASSARLEVSGDINLTNPLIQLSGRTNASVAIQNLSNENTISGDINLQAGGSVYLIQSDSGNLTLSGMIANGFGTGTRVLTVSGTGNGLISGAIANGTGSTALTKSGSGTWTVSGNNTYTGATLISAGSLLVNGALGNSAVTVEAAATIGGTGSLGGDLTLSAASFFKVADLADPLSVAGTITLGSGFGIANLTGIDWDSLTLETPYTLITTSQSFDETSIANFGVTNAAPVGTGRFAYFQNGSLSMVVIPEPATTLLGGLGLLCVLRRRRN